MNILLFGAKEHGSQVAQVLRELGHNLFIVYLIEEIHEVIDYQHLKEFAKFSDIYAISHKEAKEELILSLVNKEKIDIILCIKWRFKISEKIINSTKYGGFVIHDSILPKYRGFAPLNWAIINGESEVGATLFNMIDEIDSGPIVAQKKFKINENNDIAFLEKEMIKVYKNLISENIDKVINKNCFVSQDENEASYCCMRRPEDGRINWDQSAIEIHNLIRGLAPPFPCAFAFYKDEKIEITKTRVFSTVDRYVGKITGRILGREKEGVKVLTGQGVIMINKVRSNNNVIEAIQYFKTIKIKLC